MGDGGVHFSGFVYDVDHCSVYKHIGTWSAEGARQLRHDVDCGSGYLGFLGPSSLGVTNLLGSDCASMPGI